MAFNFKQFKVNDDRSSMKVGTDAVLLGAWADGDRAASILEVGSGSGVISLMLAQRFPASRIEAIDIHSESVEEATENFYSSPWPDILSAQNISIQDFAESNESKFDLIVSNPPFFNDSLLPPDTLKRQAKHTGSLPYTELINSIVKLLHGNGKFVLILPYDSKDAFTQIAMARGLYLSQELIIYPAIGKPANRFISEWTRKKKKQGRKELFIRNSEREYTKEYKVLTEDFYLAL